MVEEVVDCVVVDGGAGVVGSVHSTLPVKHPEEHGFDVEVIYKTTFFF